MTAPNDDDPILHALRALPRGEADPTAGDRVKRAALSTFAREHEARRSELASNVAHVWSRYGVPAMLATAAIVYLSWAFTATSALYR